MFYNKDVYNSMLGEKDLFYPLQRRGMCDIRKINEKNNEYEIIVSYDMILILMSIIELNFLSFADVVSIKILDERMYCDSIDLGIIRSFMKVLRKTIDKKIKSLSIELSDDMIGIYNYIINSDYPKLRNRVILNMSIDRHPVINDGRSNMKMSLSLGTNTFSVKQLMMLSDEDLEYLVKNGFISKENYSEVINLKSVVEDFNKYLEENFYLDRLNDFHKVQLVHRYIRGKINTIYREESRSQEYHGCDIDDSYVTYISQKGSLLAKSKLMDILLSRSLLKVNSCLLTGKSKNVQSVWVGTVIENSLYCSNLLNPHSMSGVNEDCVIETDNINLKLYPMNFLCVHKSEGIDYELDDGYYRKKPYTRKK